MKRNEKTDDGPRTTDHKQKTIDNWKLVYTRNGAIELTNKIEFLVFIIIQGHILPVCIYRLNVEFGEYGEFFLCDALA